MENQDGNRGDPCVFSLIVPVFNVKEDYFSRCIESLVKQTLSAIEIIIVDDGSDSLYAALYDRYAKADERISIIHQSNLGVSAARNLGIVLSHADWIMFVDADDWIELDACERLYQKLLETYCDILLFDHVKEYSNEISKGQWTGLEENKIYYTSDFQSRELFYRRAMGTPNLENINHSIIYYCWDKVYKRKFLLNNKLQFPEGLTKSEDKVFILSCFEKMNVLYYYGAPLYHYRISALGATYRYSDDVVDERRALCKYLEPIARRMDRVLADLSGNNAYDQIYKDYNRFVFGIISSVLFSKFYHKDYPGSKAQRRREVFNFLKSEPFHTALETCKYRELGTEGKLKKFMLIHGFTTLYIMLFRIKKRIKKQNLY